MRDHIVKKQDRWPRKAPRLQPRMRQNNGDEYRLLLACRGKMRRPACLGIASRHVAGMRSGKAGVTGLAL